MDCPKCHQAIEPDSKFCKNCGAQVPRPVEQTTDTDQPDAATTFKEHAAKASSKKGDVYSDPNCEKQIWQGRPAWRSYYGLWALWALAGAVVIGAAYKWRAPDSFVKMAWLLTMGAGVAIFVREALFVLGLSYRLTTQRLFVHRGIITRVTDQLELMRVDDVRLRQGVVDRLVNTGDVEVMGSDETDELVTLQSISAPAEVAESLRLHVRGARSKSTLMVENI